MAKPKRRWRKAPDELEVLIPLNGLFPNSACPHGRDISRGQYCPVCDKLRLRGGHHRLIRNPKEDPPKEPQKTYAPGRPGGLGTVKKAPDQWTMRGQRETVKAWTKCEARAAFKQLLNVERLPIGAKVERVKA